MFNDHQINHLFDMIELFSIRGALLTVLLLFLYRLIKEEWWRK